VRHRRIDVHQHIVPPAYARWLAAQGRLEAGGRVLPEWSVEAALALMADHDIAHAVLSVSTPGVHLNPAVRRDPIARAQARDVNEAAAWVAHDHPDRFAFVVTLTLPDVDGALAELAYAYDALDAAGVVLELLLRHRALRQPGRAPEPARVREARSRAVRQRHALRAARDRRLLHGSARRLCGARCRRPRRDRSSQCGSAVPPIRRRIRASVIRIVPRTVCAS
jgi:hypothetical protein